LINYSRLKRLPAGFTTGGGYGWTSSKYGLVCHNLISVEAVLADGSVVPASEPRAWCDADTTGPTPLPMRWPPMIMQGSHTADQSLRPARRAVLGTGIGGFYGDQFDAEVP
jgi:FAD binding domain